MSDKTKAIIINLHSKGIFEYFIFSTGIFFTYLSSLYSYLLFHSIAELFSIIISGGIFLIGWNSRKYIKNSFFSVLGISFVFVGIIDLIHTLAYSGMGIFIGFTSNLPTQLWISARYLQASSFLFALLVMNRQLNSYYLLLGYTIIDALLLVMIFQGIFPNCYIEFPGLTGSLTSFKIMSEYIINYILLLCLGFLIRLKREFSKKVFAFLISFLLSSIISELAFTFYVSVFDFSNFLGHIFKILAFYFMYKAIIETGLESPFQLLFRKLKVSEESLRAQTLHLMKAYSESDQIFNASLALRLLDTNFNVIKVNKTYCKVFNVNEEDIIGKKCYELFPHSFCNTEKCAMNQIISGKVLEEYELAYIHENEELLYLIVNSAPFRSPEGDFLGIIQNYTNITQRKLAQRELEHFVSTISHELRTPISILIMSLDYIENYRDKMSNETFERLQLGIKKNIYLLKELVEDILMLSQIDEMKLDIEWKKYEPYDILNKIIDLMKPVALDKNINIISSIDKDIFLYGDQKKIDQIYRILLDNAIKYSKKGYKIEVHAVDNYLGKFNQKHLEGVLIQFKDEGIGILKEDLPHIFERFFRSNQVTDIPGTGLGLPIAKELINLHLGSVYVESVYEKGTTFSLFFPKTESKI